MNGEVVVVSLNLRPRGLCHHRKEKNMWAAAILAKMLPKETCLVIALLLRADNELYQTINSSIIRLEYFDIFKDSKEHLERLKNYPVNHCSDFPASTLIELANMSLISLACSSPCQGCLCRKILEDRMLRQPPKPLKRLIRSTSDRRNSLYLFRR